MSERPRNRALGAPDSLPTFQHPVTKGNVMTLRMSNDRGSIPSLVFVCDLCGDVIKYDNRAGMMIYPVGSRTGLLVDVFHAHKGRGCDGPLIVCRSLGSLHDRPHRRPAGAPDRLRHRLRLRNLASGSGCRLPDAPSPGQAPECPTAHRSAQRGSQGLCRSPGCAPAAPVAPPASATGRNDPLPGGPVDHDGKLSR
jgi:hypothetical protein